MKEIDYNKMSLHELREVARVQAHELSKLKTTQFKDEFARRIGLLVIQRLRTKPFEEWEAAQYTIYADVATSHQIGAWCWRMGGA